MNMTDLVIISIAAAAEVTASGNGSAIDISDFYGLAKFTLDSTAGLDADDTLDVKLQHSADGSTGWTDITGGAFAQVTDAGAAFETLTIDIDGLDGYIRAVDTVAGTPTFHRAVTMAGVKQYS